ncbi:MAG: MBL fold metallo-hydrolase [Nitrospinaceae bacterium]|nr:MBL fold metallo-hydrolase [Nitrospinaceae bacterium]NIR56982.1 MBL fold metallo-hydrolase [Nitrospinaceae bacterium]NIS87439.1 MBL fold metallo-hydrolase [Nitrospinaceae bacterium]NIT84288.1 MBL fold metallo-hydrolase [Nitrospinaceae bacterium]NIU46478.1 MBL fold metallo-hydrolase [Nitrospinaceae bacterium]
MKITFLGTGTSTGIPSLCCPCEVCVSEDPRNKRLRASALVQSNGFHFLIDTSTDLRQQCLIHNVSQVDAVLYTHHHADHVHGIDELRCFNFYNQCVIPCYGNEETLAAIQQNFSYIFNGQKPMGGGVPKLDMITLDSRPFFLGDVRVTPVDIHHGNIMILGYRINDAAYVTDCSGIPDRSKEILAELEVLILNALGFEPHATHFCLDQALAAIEELRPKRAILTHINHKFDHEKVSRDLPENVELAYDGMTLEL